MRKKTNKFRWEIDGFTLIELMIAIAVSSVMATLMYTFFQLQNNVYSVQDKVVEMEQNSRAAINMMRREIRMAGYNAMGDELINNLSSFVPASFIPTYPLTVNLDANPKITLGSGTEPDMITFLSVLTSKNNPTTFSVGTVAGATNITLNLNSTETDDQYNIGDILHIGAASEYARVTAISGNTLTIDTNPQIAGNQGLVESYPIIGGIGYAVAEISVTSYAVFNEENDPAHAYHTSGHPVLKRTVNNGGYQPVAENITDLQISNLGSGEIQLTLSSRTDKPDDAFSTNDGYRTINTNTKIKIRNVDNISTGTNCDPPDAPANLTLAGLNAAYPCKINITWDAVTTTEEECDVTGYIVYYDDNSSVYGNSVEVGNITNYVLDLGSLKACTYYVSVSAINSSGIGAKTAEQQIVDGVAPDQPTGLAAVNVNGVERQVNVSWNTNTDCDLNGYYLYKGTSSDGAYTQINTSIIPREITNYTDTDFIPIDCQTYYYKVGAVDFCPNLDFSSNVSASPTAPAAPTDPTISTVSGIDTINWTISADDQDVGGDNYVTSYKVYGDGSLLTSSLTAGSHTYSHSSGPSIYEVSTLDACGNESEKLLINAVCAQAPAIAITSPASGATVSGTVSISGSVTPSVGRTINNVQMKIDDGDWVELGSGPSWSHDWNTTEYTYGEHTITIKASDTIGCYMLDAMILNVDNTETAGDQLFCKLYACKESGNEYIYMVVYVHDQDDNPVSGATVEASHLFGSGSGSYTIVETDTPGYYGGAGTPPSECGNLATDANETISGDGLSINSKGKYQDDEIPIISINVSKPGFVFSSCSRDFSSEISAYPPIITIDSPISGASVSGTQTIQGSVVVADGRTLASVQIQINDGAWIDLTASSNWSYDWDTTAFTDGSYCITVKATDSEGLENSNIVPVVTVANTPTEENQLYCKVFACKTSGNQYVYMAVYVYDQNNDPVSGATITSSISFGSTYISEVSGHSGWYGGDQDSGCGDLQTQTGESWGKTGIAMTIKSQTKHRGVTITITAQKDGYDNETSCSRTFSD